MTLPKGVTLFFMFKTLNVTPSGFAFCVDYFSIIMLPLRGLCSPYVIFLSYLIPHASYLMYPIPANRRLLHDRCFICQPFLPALAHGIFVDVSFCQVDK